MENKCRIVWPNAPRSAIPTAERSATLFPLRTNEIGQDRLLRAVLPTGRAGPHPAVKLR